MGKFILFAGILCLLWDHLPCPSFEGFPKWLRRHSWGIVTLSFLAVDFFNIGFFSYTSHFNLSPWYTPVVLIETIMFGIATAAMVMIGPD